MKRQSQVPSEPRSQLIIRHAQKAIRASGLTIGAYATRVAEEYIQRVALHERQMEFYTGAATVDGIAKAERANAQLITRIFNNVVKMPDDLEESLVAALPDAMRGELVRELAARYGLLAARAPVATNDVRGQMEEFAALSREFGQTIESLAPIFADGKCDATDRGHIEHALRELDDLIAAGVTVRAQLRAAIEDDGRVTPIAGRRA